MESDRHWLTFGERIPPWGRSAVRSSRQGTLGLPLIWAFLPSSHRLIHRRSERAQRQLSDTWSGADPVSPDPFLACEPSTRRQARSPRSVTLAATGSGLHPRLWKSSGHGRVRCGNPLDDHGRWPAQRPPDRAAVVLRQADVSLGTGSTWWMLSSHVRPPTSCLPCSPSAHRPSRVEPGCSRGPWWPAPPVPTRRARRCASERIDQSPE